MVSGGHLDMSGQWEDGDAAAGGKSAYEAAFPALGAMSGTKGLGRGDHAKQGNCSGKRELHLRCYVGENAFNVCIRVLEPAPKHSFPGPTTRDSLRMIGDPVAGVFRKTIELPLSCTSCTWQILYEEREGYRWEKEGAQDGHDGGQVGKVEGVDVVEQDRAEGKADVKRTPKLLPPMTVSLCRAADHNGRAVVKHLDATSFATTLADEPKYGDHSTDDTLDFVDRDNANGHLSLQTWRKGVARLVESTLLHFKSRSQPSLTGGRELPWGAGRAIPYEPERCVRLVTQIMQDSMCREEQQDSHDCQELWRSTLSEVGLEPHILVAQALLGMRDTFCLEAVYGVCHAIKGDSKTMAAVFAVSIRAQEVDGHALALRGALMKKAMDAYRLSYRHCDGARTWRTGKLVPEQIDGNIPHALLIPFSSPHGVPPEQRDCMELEKGDSIEAYLAIPAWFFYRDRFPPSDFCSVDATFVRRITLSTNEDLAAVTYVWPGFLAYLLYRSDHPSQWGVIVSLLSGMKSPMQHGICEFATVLRESCCKFFQIVQRQREMGQVRQANYNTQQRLQLGDRRARVLNAADTAVDEDQQSRAATSEPLAVELFVEDGRSALLRLIEIALDGLQGRADEMKHSCHSRGTQMRMRIDHGGVWSRLMKAFKQLAKTVTFPSCSGADTCERLSGILRLAGKLLQYAAPAPASAHGKGFSHDFVTRHVNEVADTLSQVVRHDAGAEEVEVQHVGGALCADVPWKIVALLEKFLDKAQKKRGYPATHGNSTSIKRNHWHSAGEAHGGGTIAASFVGILLAALPLSSTAPSATPLLLPFAPQHRATGIKQKLFYWLTNSDFVGLWIGSLPLALVLQNFDVLAPLCFPAIVNKVVKRLETTLEKFRHADLFSSFAARQRYEHVVQDHHNGRRWGSRDGEHWRGRVLRFSYGYGRGRSNYDEANEQPDLAKRSVVDLLSDFSLAAVVRLLLKIVCEPVTSHAHRIGILDVAGKHTPAPLLAIRRAICLSIEIGEIIAQWFASLKLQSDNGGSLGHDAFSQVGTAQAKIVDVLTAYSKLQSMARKYVQFGGRGKFLAIDTNNGAPARGFVPMRNSVKPICPSSTGLAYSVDDVGVRDANRKPSRSFLHDDSCGGRTTGAGENGHEHEVVDGRTSQSFVRTSVIPNPTSSWWNWNGSSSSWTSRNAYSNSLMSTSTKPSPKIPIRSQPPLSDEFTAVIDRIHAQQQRLHTLRAQYRSFVCALEPLLSRRSSVLSLLQHQLLRNVTTIGELTEVCSSFWKVGELENECILAEVHAYFTDCRDAYGLELEVLANYNVEETWDNDKECRAAAAEFELHAGQSCGEVETAEPAIDGPEDDHADLDVGTGNGNERPSSKSLLQQSNYAVFEAQNYYHAWTENRFEDGDACLLDRVLSFWRSTRKRIAFFLKKVFEDEFALEDFAAWAPLVANHSPQCIRTMCRISHRYDDETTGTLVEQWTAFRAAYTNYHFVRELLSFVIVRLPRQSPPAESGSSPRSSTAAFEAVASSSCSIEVGPDALSDKLLSLMSNRVRGGGSVTLDDEESTSAEPVKARLATWVADFTSMDFAGAVWNALRSHGVLAKNDEEDFQYDSKLLTEKLTGVRRLLPVFEFLKECRLDQNDAEFMKFLDVAMDETAQDASLQAALQDLRAVRPHLAKIGKSKKSFTKFVKHIFRDFDAAVLAQGEGLLEQLDQVRVLHKELQESGGRELRKLRQLAGGTIFVGFCSERTTALLEAATTAAGADVAEDTTTTESWSQLIDPRELLQVQLGHVVSTGSATTQRWVPPGSATTTILNAREWEDDVAQLSVRQLRSEDEQLRARAVTLFEAARLAATAFAKARAAGVPGAQTEKWALEVRCEAYEAALEDLRDLEDLCKTAKRDWKAKLRGIRAALPEALNLPISVWVYYFWSYYGRNAALSASYIQQVWGKFPVRIRKMFGKPKSPASITRPPPAPHIRMVRFGHQEQNPPQVVVPSAGSLSDSEQVVEDRTQLFNSAYLTLLDMYRLEIGRLPTRWELLACTRETTQEEVDLFVRRMVAAPEWLYAIVEPEQLPAALQQRAIDKLAKWGVESDSGASSRSRKSVKMKPGDKWLPSVRLLVISELGASSAFVGIACAEPEDIRTGLGKNRDATTTAAEQQRAREDALRRWCSEQLAADGCKVSAVTSASPGCGKTKWINGGKSASWQGWSGVSARITVNGFISSATYRILADKKWASVSGHASRQRVVIRVGDFVSGPLDKMLFDFLVLNAVIFSNGQLVQRSGEALLEVNQQHLLDGHLPLAFERHYVALPNAHSKSPSADQRSEVARRCDFVYKMPLMKCLSHLFAYPLYAARWSYFPTFIESGRAAELQNLGDEDFVYRAMNLMKRELVLEEVEEDDTQKGKALPEDEGPVPLTTYSLVSRYLGFLGRFSNLEQNKPTLRPLVKRLVEDFIRREGFRNEGDVLTQIMRVAMPGHALFADANKERKPVGFESFVWTPTALSLLLHLEIRFATELPAIFEGETGCGKTELIKFWCALRGYRLFTFTVHGGYDNERVVRVVNQKIAEIHATVGRTKKEKALLFIDEMNASPAIDLLKEVVTECRLNGVTLRGSGRKLFEVVGAINPYRKRTEAELRRVRHMGMQTATNHNSVQHLGNKNNTNNSHPETHLADLVYRVHRLPEALEFYKVDFPDMPGELMSTVITKLLQDAGCCLALCAAVTVAHRFAKSHADSDYTFVSFRDVFHAVQVYKLFCRAEVVDALGGETLFKEQERVATAVSVAYVMKMGSAARKAFHAFASSLVISQEASPSADSLKTTLDIANNFAALQRRIAQQTEVPKGVVMNTALKENVTMLVIGIALKIPTFIIGLPGSSKSLAKTVVQRNMLGPDQSRAALYKALPSAQLRVLQCSPHTVAKDIQEHCGNVQRIPDGVAVLEEIGLAELSADMPLKVLHDIFDTNASVGRNGDPAESASAAAASTSRAVPAADHPRKIAFVATSNWNLDPAKMSRGLFVTRSMPSEEDLVDTMHDFAGADQLAHLKPILQRLSRAFLEVVGVMAEKKEFPEGAFYALRDVYSCVTKMVQRAEAGGGGHAGGSEVEVEAQGGGNATDLESIVQTVIQPNFSGLPAYAQREVDAIFERHLLMRDEGGDRAGIDTDTKAGVDVGHESITEGASTAEDRSSVPTSPTSRQLQLPRLPALRLLAAAFTQPAVARYPMLVCSNPIATLRLLQVQRIVPPDAHILCGSGFPTDQGSLAYTHAVIRELRPSLSSGRPVVLLYHDSVYESLYDLLNKFYAEYSGRYFVDLGIGHARVKVDIHRGLQLLVLADHAEAYAEFPPPLLNRFEKHRLDAREEAADRFFPSAPREERMRSDFDKLCDWVRTETEHRGPCVGVTSASSKQAMEESLLVLLRCSEKATSEDQDQEVGVKAARLNARTHDELMAPFDEDKNRPISTTPLEAAKRHLRRCFFSPESRSQLSLAHFFAEMRDIVGKNFHVTTSDTDGLADKIQGCLNAANFKHEAEFETALKERLAFCLRYSSATAAGATTTSCTATGRATDHENKRTCTVLDQHQQAFDFDARPNLSKATTACGSSFSPDTDAGSLFGPGSPMTMVGLPTFEQHQVVPSPDAPASPVVSDFPPQESFDPTATSVAIPPNCVAVAVFGRTLSRKLIADIEFTARRFREKCGPEAAHITIMLLTDTRAERSLDGFWDHVHVDRVLPGKWCSRVLPAGKWACSGGPLAEKLFPQAKSRPSDEESESQTQAFREVLPGLVGITGGVLDATTTIQLCREHHASAARALMEFMPELVLDEVALAFADADADAVDAEDDPPGILDALLREDGREADSDGVDEENGGRNRDGNTATGAAAKGNHKHHAGGGGPANANTNKKTPWQRLLKRLFAWDTQDAGARCASSFLDAVADFLPIVLAEAIERCCADWDSECAALAAQPLLFAPVFRHLLESRFCQQMSSKKRMDQQRRFLAKDEGGTEGHWYINLHAVRAAKTTKQAWAAVEWLGDQHMIGNEDEGLESRPRREQGREKLARDDANEADDDMLLMMYHEEDDQDGVEGLDADEIESVDEGSTPSSETRDVEGVVMGERDDEAARSHPSVTFEKGKLGSSLEQRPQHPGAGFRQFRPTSFNDHPAVYLTEQHVGEPSSTASATSASVVKPQPQILADIEDAAILPVAVGAKSKSKARSGSWFGSTIGGPFKKIAEQEQEHKEKGEKLAATRTFRTSPQRHLKRHSGPDDEEAHRFISALVADAVLGDEKSQPSPAKRKKLLAKESQYGECVSRGDPVFAAAAPPGVTSKCLNARIGRAMQHRWKPSFPAAGATTQQLSPAVRASLEAWSQGMQRTFDLFAQDHSAAGARFLFQSLQMNFNEAQLAPFFTEKDDRLFWEIVARFGTADCCAEEIPAEMVETLRGFVLLETEEENVFKSASHLLLRHRRREAKSSSGDAVDEAESRIGVGRIRGDRTKSVGAPLRRMSEAALATRGSSTAQPAPEGRAIGFVSATKYAGVPKRLLEIFGVLDLEIECDRRIVECGVIYDEALDINSNSPPSLLRRRKDDARGGICSSDSKKLLAPTVRRSLQERRKSEPQPAIPLDLL